MTGFMWFCVLAVGIMAVMHMYANAKAAMADWQRKNTAKAYKRYIMGVREFEAQERNGEWHV